MSNIYRMENARGEVRRARSLTTFHEAGDVYYDLDGFHFINEESMRMPRRDWDWEGRTRNAAERFVIESHNSPVLVVDETQGDLFVGIYGIKDCEQRCGGGCKFCDATGLVDRRGSPLYGENLEALKRWLPLRDHHRAMEQAQRMQIAARADD